jgi:predicted amidohydrolase
MSSISSAPALKSFRIALIQMGGITDVKEKNRSHALKLIQEAAKGGEKGKKPDVIVLPECFNSPYGAQFFPQYAETIGYKEGAEFKAEESQSDTVKMLSSAAKEAGVWLIGGSIPERDPDNSETLYNTSTVYSPEGKLIAFHRKVHLFDIDIPGKITFKESETLTGGDKLTHFDTAFGRMGLGICYDIRFPEMAMVATRQGCQIMVYPGAFNLTTGPLHWELLQRARAVDNQIYVVTCSPARDMSASYNAWGHSTIVDPMGQIVATTDEKESIVFADIDASKVEEARKGIPVTTQHRFDIYPDIGA